MVMCTINSSLIYGKAIPNSKQFSTLRRLRVLYMFAVCLFERCTKCSSLMHFFPKMWFSRLDNVRGGGLHPLTNPTGPLSSERPEGFRTICVTVCYLNTERLKCNFTCRFVFMRNFSKGKHVLSVFEHGEHQHFARKEEKKAGIPFPGGGGQNICLHICI